MTKKEKTLMRIQLCIEIGKSGVHSFVPAFELGTALFDVSDMLESDPDEFEDAEVKKKLKEMLDILGKVIESLTRDEAWGWGILRSALEPGKDLFPNRKLHPWWWWPEMYMNQREYKQWVKFLKK